MFKFINRHMGWTIVIGLSLILFIIMLAIFISLFFGSGQSKYGNRLEGIEDVKLSSSFLKELEDELSENESVVDANVRLQGKIVYIVYEVNSDVSVDSAKEIASLTLDKFSEEEIAYYDFSYLVKWTIVTTNEEEEEIVEIKGIEGTKHPKKESITWSNS